MRTAFVGFGTIHAIVHPEGRSARSARHVAERGVIAAANRAMASARSRGWLSVLAKLGFAPGYVDQPKGSPLFGRAHEVGALGLGTPGTAFRPDLADDLADSVVGEPRVGAFRRDEFLNIESQTMPKPSPYVAKVVVPLPSDELVRAVVGEGYDPAKTLNVVKMFAGTDDMFDAAMGLVKAVFQAEGIDPKVREVIILRAAKVLDAPYEWQANATMAFNVGLSADEIEAVGADGPVTAIDAEYVLVCAATDELSNDGTLSDATLAALLSRYGETLCRKVILTISWFNLLSLFLNGCRVPMETTDKIGTKTSPLG